METIKKYNKERKNLILFIISSNIFYLGVGYFLNKKGFFDSLLIFIGWLIGYLILWIKIQIKRNKYISVCKYKFIKPKVESFGIEYDPKKRVYFSLVRSSDLVGSFHGFASDGSDYVKGNNFMFSYLNLKREEKYTVTDNNGNTKTETRIVTVFDGIFFVGYFPKKIKGEYFVTLNSFHLSDILPIFNDKSRIILDMPEFEKVFDVYGSDQIEGRYIFDFTFMQSLLNVYKLIAFENFSIRNNKYFMIFPGLKFDESIFNDMKKCIENNINLIYTLSKIDEILIKKIG